MLDLIRVRTPGPLQCTEEGPKFQEPKADDEAEALVIAYSYKRKQAAWESVGGEAVWATLGWEQKLAAVRAQDHHFPEDAGPRPPWPEGPPPWADLPPASDPLALVLRGLLPARPGTTRAALPPLPHPPPQLARPGQVLDASRLVGGLEDLAAVLGTLRCVRPLTVATLGLRHCACLRDPETREAAVAMLAGYLEEAGAPLPFDPRAPGRPRETCVEVVYLEGCGLEDHPKLLGALVAAWARVGHLHGELPEMPEPPKNLNFPVTLRRKAGSYQATPAARLAMMPAWAAEIAGAPPPKAKNGGGKKKKK